MAKKAELPARELDDLIKVRIDSTRKNLFVENCDGRDISVVIRRLIDLYNRDQSILDK